MENDFSKWVHIKNKDNLLYAGHSCPGIYAIAYSNTNLHEVEFDYIEEIIYFGMSISQKGLQGRLYQFFSTINGKSKQHSGAKRMCCELNNKDVNWKEKIYISLKPFIHCSTNIISPLGLLHMGDVVKEEYNCFSKYFEKFNKLPHFNENEFFRKNIVKNP
jgi:hypothetical protein